MVAIRRSSRAVLNIFLVYNYEQREEFIPNGYPEVFGKAVKKTARHRAQNALQRSGNHTLKSALFFIHGHIAYTWGTFLLFFRNVL